MSQIVISDKLQSKIRPKFVDLTDIESGILQK